MTDNQHIKITSYEEQEDGAIKTVTESYFDKLASRKESIIKQVKTNPKDFLADLMSCTDVIVKQQTKELHLIITANDWNQVDRIVKEYTTSKESFKKR